MSDNGQEPVEPTLSQMVECYRKQKEKGLELVKAMFREAVENAREQDERKRLLVERVHREAIDQARGQPLPPYQSPTVHYTELPVAQADSQLCNEWNFYCREVGRLLGEGQEGRFVLIKGEKIIGIWDTQEEAEAVAFHKYPLAPRLIHKVQRCERVVRGPSRFWRCPT